MSGKENKDENSPLLYVTTIQQDVGYFTRLQDELSTIKIQKETALKEIENLKNGINEDRIQIENLNLSKGAMRNVVVIQEPIVSSMPIAPQRRKIVLLTAIASLLAGLVLASFLEYWNNSAA